MSEVREHSDRPGAGEPWEPDSLRDWFNMLPVVTSWGLRCTRVAPGSAEVVMEVDETHRNPSGAVNGGVLALLADQVGGLVAASLAPRGDRTPVTAMLSMRCLRPAERAPLVAAGTAEKWGSRLTFLTVEVADHLGATCASVTGTWLMPTTSGGATWRL
jgi:uncharacterized protein (TIGR00369 family)